MKIFIVVALIAIAALHQISAELKEEWVQTCIEETDILLQNVSHLYRGVFADTNLSKSSWEFVLCYLNANGAFDENFPQRENIVDNLSKLDERVNNYLDACGINEDAEYEPEAAYDLYKCYMQNSHLSLFF